ncbi:Uncharacterised protein (plasmid) [Legionella adelaidensis]|uniref:HEAT repeat domain-containing protein n=1 Tax=Legionella adelaidensis TaxID=45056 RepID=A0A0W0R1H1_9GAMM|nr:hypothetical protein [Legionella adelaidensis]KTC64809.1 hypothetical protein Lade_2103 [Legionella adelaidensis]VEH86201.1 Uncharacterised protein [Legionella adelaidensis]
MKSFLVVLGIVFSLHVFAETTVDIYGERNKNFDAGILKFRKQISEIEEKSHKLMIEPNLTKKEQSELEKLLTDKILLSEKIRRLYGFLYVGFASVYYAPGKLNTTIEVISRETPERFNYFGPEYLNEIVENKDDIIEKAQNYYQTGGLLFVNNKLVQDQNCQAFHCLWGFASKELKPYKQQFYDAISHNKNYIIEVLKESSIPHRKTGALILIGFFPDPQEIIHLASLSVNDGNEEVRNMAMRIIGTTLEKVKVNDLDPRPYLSLLNSPIVTDRNKALLVLFHLAQSKPSAEIIIKEGGSKLLELLALKQINNHNPAYMVLRQLSGKEYGEYDLAAWENWLKTSRLAT